MIDNLAAESSGEIESDKDAGENGGADTRSGTLGTSDDVDVGKAADAGIYAPEESGRDWVSGTGGDEGVFGTSGRPVLRPEADGDGSSGTASAPVSASAGETGGVDGEGGDGAPADERDGIVDFVRRHRLSSAYDKVPEGVEDTIDIEAEDFFVEDALIRYDRGEIGPDEAKQLIVRHRATAVGPSASDAEWAPIRSAQNEFLPESVRRRNAEEAELRQEADARFVAENRALAEEALGGEEFANLDPDVASSLDAHLLDSGIRAQYAVDIKRAVASGDMSYERAIQRTDAIVARASVDPHRSAVFDMEFAQLDPDGYTSGRTRPMLDQLYIDVANGVLLDFEAALKRVRSGEYDYTGPRSGLGGGGGPVAFDRPDPKIFTGSVAERTFGFADVPLPSAAFDFASADLGDASVARGLTLDTDTRLAAFGRPDRNGPWNGSAGDDASTWTWGFPAAGIAPGDVGAGEDLAFDFTENAFASDGDVGIADASFGDELAVGDLTLDTDVGPGGFGEGGTFAFEPVELEPVAAAPEEFDFTRGDFA